MSNATPRIQTLRQNLSLVRGRECRVYTVSTFYVYFILTAREHRIHIQLGNLPRTALPSDIRRLVARSKLQGVSDGVPYFFHLYEESLTFRDSRPRLSSLAPYWQSFHYFDTSRLSKAKYGRFTEGYTGHHPRSITVVTTTRISAIANQRYQRTGGGLRQGCHYW